MEQTYKDECEIIELAASVDNPRICFYPAESDLGHRLLAALRGRRLIKRERPDFEDLKGQLTVEVMIVDDHPRPGKKDATRARQAVMLEEVREAGLARVFPNASLTAIADTGLPTEQDHNFRSYLENFTRVVDKHARNVGAYRNGRPEFKLAFLILDESTAYFETMGSFAKDGRSRPHFHFADRNFLASLRKSGADCIAWLTPYKRLPTDRGVFPLPRLAIIDVSVIDLDEPKHFDPKRMRSAEI